MTELYSLMQQLLRTYPDVTTCLDKIVDPATVEHAKYHELTVKYHVGFMAVRLRNDTYWLSRDSNIRNTAGYESYHYALVGRTEGENDDTNVTYRFFREKWLEWQTVNL